MSDSDRSDSEEISESKLQEEIQKVLKDADLSTTSIKKVIAKLEQNLGVDLSSKKAMIDKMVMDYVNAHGSDSDEEEEEEEEEERPKKRKKKGSDDDDWRGKSKKEAKPKPKKASGGRGKGSGYTRPYKLSPALADLMGKEQMPRHEVVKRVWEIIKSKNLYDPNNKQFAICDDALYKVIGTKRFRTFGMMKYLKTHFLDD